MSNFFSDISFELGTLDSQGQFESFNYLNEFGSLTAKVTLTKSSSSAFSYFAEDVAVIHHRVYFQIDDGNGNYSDFNNFDNNSNFFYTLRPEQLGSISTNSVVNFTESFFGNPIEIGKYLGTLRSDSHSVKALVRSVKKNLDYSQDFFDFSQGTIGNTPTGWTGNGLRRVSNGTNSAMVLAGTATTVANTDDAPSSTGNFRVARINKAYGAFRDIQVEFQATYVSTGGNYVSGTTTYTNAPEFNNGEHLWVQYKFGNGTWQSGKIITNNMVSANTFANFKMRIHQSTSSYENIQIRFVSKTMTSGSSTNDVWIVDSVRVLTTDANAADQDSGNDGFLDSSIDSSSQIAHALWEWDESHTNVYWENLGAGLPTHLINGNDNEPYFEIENGSITQARVVFGGRGESKTQMISSGNFFNQIEIARASKFEITVQNWNPALAIPPAGFKSESIDVDGGFFLQSNYVDGQWSQQNQLQRIELDLSSSYFTIQDFWETQTIYVSLSAYGTASDGTDYLVDSYNFTSQDQPFHFSRDTNQLPYSALSFKQPGTDSYDLSISNVRIRTTDTTSKAYKYNVGVWNGAGWQLGGATTNGWTGSGVLDTIINGEKIFFSGSHDVTPSNPYSYYGAAGQQGTADTLLRVYSRALKGPSLTNDKIDGNNIVSIVPTLRRGWDFNTNVANVGIQLGMSHDNNSSWSQDSLTIYADNSSASAHWFKIYFTTKRNGAVLNTDIYTVPGTFGTFNGLTTFNGTYYRDLGSIVPSGTLNTRIPSIYNNGGYQVNIIVEALNNLEQTISSTDSGDIEVSTDFGLEAADLSNTSSIIVEGTGNTGARYVKATFSKNPNTGRSAFFRMDLYKTSIVNTNHLGTYFAPGTSNNLTNVTRTEFIKATGFSNFQTKLEASETYEKVYLTDLANVGAYGNNIILAQLRPLDDAGGFLDTQDESHSYTGYNFHFGMGTAVSTVAGSDDGTAGQNYWLEVLVASSSTNKTNDAYDYIVLNASQGGNSVSYTLPTNGVNSAWYGTNGGRTFTQDENNAVLNVASLLSNRYTSNTITCNLEAYAYGLDTPNTTATIKSQITKFLTVPAWDWTFATHSVTLPTNVANVGNRLEYCRLVVKGTASNNTSNVAEKFRLRVWNDTNNLYSGTDASDRKEFILQGSQFTTAEFTRYVESVNNNYLDISDIIPGIRWEDNQVAWDLYAVKSDGTTQVGNGKSGILTIPALEWDLDTGNTTATLQNNTYEDRRIKITVARTNLTDVIPKIRVIVRRAEDADGNQFAGSFLHRIILTPTILDTTGTTNSDLTEDFYFNFSSLTGITGNPISMIDIYDTVKYDVSVQGAYIGSIGEVNAFGDEITREVSALASWKMDANNTNATLLSDTASSKSVDFNIRGVAQRVKTESSTRPTGFNITFTRSDTGAQSSDFIAFSANVDNNTPNNVSIAGLYDTIATSNHTLTCLIEAVNGSGTLQTISKTISMSAEPKMAIQYSPLGGPLVAPNGDEYIAIVFKPTAPAGFLSANETISLSFLLDGDATQITLSGDESNSWQYITLPTAKNVNTDISRVASTYPLTLSADYNMNRGHSNNLISGDDYSATYDKIYHRFPKVLNIMAHNFDVNGDGQIVFSFEQNDGLDVNYIDNNPEWDFDITIEEEVVGTLDSTMLNQTKTTSSTAAFFNTNSIPLVSKIPLEANYSSNITMTLQENFNNNISIGPVPNTPYITTINNNNLNTSAPVFTGDYSGTQRYFQMNDVTMNDIANYPNTTVIPFDVSFDDVPGTYALSGKKVSFKVPIDFNNYFTNAEPYFSFGLKIDHKDGNNIARSTGGAYIQSNGILFAESQVTQAKKDEMKQSSVYKVRDFTREGEFYTFTFDLNTPDSALDWLVTPSLSSSRQVNYTLCVYVEDELTTYDGGSRVKPGDSEGNTELVPNLTPRADFNDMSTWTLVSNNSGTDDIFSKNDTLEVVSISSNFIPTVKNSSLQVDWSFDYELEDPNKKPYSSSRILPSVRYELRNVGNSSFEISSSNGSSSLIASTANSSINLTSSLNNNSYNPKEDLEIIIRPQTEILSYTKGNNHITSARHSHINRELTVTANYRDLIIPTFDELVVDNSLNQDKVVGNSGFENEIYWFYNKEELKSTTQVFDYSKEKMKIVRKIRQGSQVYDIGHAVILDMYAADVTRLEQNTHSPDLWKMRWTDNLNNVSDYTAQGLNGSHPYSFEYELIPCFAYYQGNDAANESIVEITDKKVSTFLVPDEFPISNNGTVGLTYNHNSEHSVELLWKHVYDESVKTLRSVDAKIYFDIYWFFDETDEQKALSDIMKPKNIKSKFYKEKQVDSNTWNLIDRIGYSYPQSEALGEEYDFSYLWNYDKMEDDYKINIAIITIVESEVLGDSLSQNIATSRGASNTLTSNVDTSKKEKKNKMLADKDLKRQSLRHAKREAEFDFSHIPNLNQIPISVTRKKAKPRGSNKPYSSST